MVLLDFELQFIYTLRRMNITVLNYMFDLHFI